MSTADRPLVVRWLLLAAVAVGLVVMHHLPTQHEQGAAMHADGPSAAVMAMTVSPTVQPMPDTDGMGAMLHECLAVVGQLTVAALLMLLLVVALVRWIRERRPSAPRALARAPDRISGASGRSLLASVCVLRL